MENFNVVPSTGKYGDSITVINDNFLLAQQEIEILRNIMSPNTKDVTVVATNTWTLENINSLISTAAGSDAEKTNAVYRVGSWNGTAYDPSVFCEYSWNGTQYKLLTVKEYGIDSTPTSGSNNVVTSDGIYDAIDVRLNKITKAQLDAIFEL